MPRIGVVGLGYWGPNLARNLQELDCAELVALCDANIERARTRRRVASPASGSTTSSTRCSPTTRSTRSRSRLPSPRISRSPARRSKAGKHVFIEKPLAASVAECVALIASRRANASVVLMPGHTFLYSPPVVAIRGLIEAGDARGALLHLDQQGQPRPPPGRRQRRLGPGPARLLDPPVLARREPDARERLHPRLRRPLDPRCRLHRPRVSEPDDRARGALLARTEQAPAHDDRRLREDGRLRRHEHRAGADLRFRGRPEGADVVRGVPAELPGRRHRLAADRCGRAALARAARLL